MPDVRSIPNLGSQGGQSCSDKWNKAMDYAKVQASQTDWWRQSLYTGEDLTGAGTGEGCRTETGKGASERAPYECLLNILSVLQRGQAVTEEQAQGLRGQATSDRT